MQSLIEPVSNLLHGIIESTRLNQTPAELRNRVTQLEERNAALEMASNTASFQQIEQQRILEGLQAQLQKEKEKTNDLALHKSLTVVLQRKVDDLQLQLDQQQQATAVSAVMFSQADLDEALSGVPGCSNAQSFIDEVDRSDLRQQTQNWQLTVAFFFRLLFFKSKPKINLAN